MEDCQRVEIHCDPANARSASVPRKLGFLHEATLRKRIELADGRYRDTMVWTLLREEYLSSPASQAQIEAFDAAGRKII